MEVQNDKYECEIRWTNKAIPHIRAATIADVGFGQGYACSKHHIATLLDQIIKVRGERSKYFGPGNNDQNIVSDAGYLFLRLREKAEENFILLPEISRLFLKGYAEGVNQFLKLAKPGEFPDWIRQATWIKPISEFDLMAYCTDIALAAGMRNLISFMAIALPPDENGPRPTPDLSTLPGGSLASNGWAIGKDISYNKKGMLLGNPHFPWVGENRFWECHLTVENLLDCYGATLIGAPGILIGFNENVAWTHTFSIGKRFILYKLELVPDKPDRYRYGNEVREMTKTKVNVDVLGSNGTTTVEKQIYSSHYGPILNLPILGWTENYAFSVKDANEDNLSFISQFIRMNLSKSLEDFKLAHEQENGMPWANTIAADNKGNTWYIDSSRTISLSETGNEILKKKLRDDPLTKMLYENRILMLDGSDPDCDCEIRPDAPIPGLIPYSDYPQISRTDFVFNANDSAWLTNPNELIELATYLQGLKEPPSVRTKACLSFLMSYVVGDEKKMTLEDMISYALSNKSILGHLIKDQLADFCLQLTNSSNDLDDKSVYLLNQVADVLRSWDGYFNLDSKGAVLFREIIAGFNLSDIKDKGNLFKDNFDPSFPHMTPCLLVDPENGRVIKDTILQAIVALNQAELNLEASLREVQFAYLSKVKYFVHGGHETDGVTNILTPVSELPYSSNEPREDLEVAGEFIAERTKKTGLRKGGYSVCHGTSFFYALSFTEDGPIAYGFLTYGQDENIDSSNHSDQIQDYIDKKPRKLLFYDHEISTCRDLKVEIVKN